MVAWKLHQFVTCEIEMAPLTVVQSNSCWIRVVFQTSVFSIGRLGGFGPLHAFKIEFKTGIGQVVTTFCLHPQHAKWECINGVTNAWHIPRFLKHIWDWDMNLWAREFECLKQLTFPEKHMHRGKRAPASVHELRLMMPVTARHCFEIALTSDTLLGEDLPKDRSRSDKSSFATLSLFKVSLALKGIQVSKPRSPCQGSVASQLTDEDVQSTWPKSGGKWRPSGADRSPSFNHVCWTYCCYFQSCLIIF